ncbi:MAG: DUF1761 domain-containing protein [Phaeodactylibacter sp.]|nr:DUF1761 domain-containing protein [Phaeodactylibacter sp.]MCB9299737.1 DUF1761 domain-containing protein [Lewinellaceae bacterium]
MKQLKFNHYAIWLSIILSQAIPLLWYSLFSERWKTLREIEHSYLQPSDTSWFFGISILGSVVAMYLLAWLFRRMTVESAREGMIAGLIIGLAFNIVSLMTIQMLAIRPLELALIDESANALVFGVAGLILGSWRQYEEAPRLE